MKRDPSALAQFWKFVFLLTLAFGVIYFVIGSLRKTTTYKISAVSSTPTNILITDVSKNSLGIVYQTDILEPTLVKYESNGVSNIAIDILGTRATKNHYARLEGLNPSSTILITIGNQSITYIMPPAGTYPIIQSKVISGIVPNIGNIDMTDTIVVLQTNDRYYATKTDKNGNWLISWTNHQLPDFSSEILYPVSANLIIYSNSGSTSKLPFAWNDIKTISVSVPTNQIRPDETKLSFWDQIVKFFKTFLPNFQLLFNSK